MRGRSKIWGAYLINNSAPLSFPFGHEAWSKCSARRMVNDNEHANTRGPLPFLQGGVIRSLERCEPLLTLEVPTHSHGSALQTSISIPYSHSVVHIAIFVKKKEVGQKGPPPRALSLLPREGLPRMFLLLHNYFKGNPTTVNPRTGKSVS